MMCCAMVRFVAEELRSYCDRPGVVARGGPFVLEGWQISLSSPCRVDGQQRLHLQVDSNRIEIQCYMAGTQYRESVHLGSSFVYGPSVAMHKGNGRVAGA